jgi:hypothetical protein
MSRRLLIITALVAGLVAASVGTAQAATVSPAKWAPKFCDAVTTYQTTISTQSDAMTSALEGTTDLNAARDQIESFLGKMVAAANTAARQVQRAGSPSSPNGAKIEARFVAGLKASSKLFAQAKAKAAQLPTTSATAFKTKGKQLGHDLSDAGEELSKSFSGIGKLDKGKKLEAAVKAAPECSSLT